MSAINPANFTNPILGAEVGVGVGVKCTSEGCSKPCEKVTSSDRWPTCCKTLRVPHIVKSSVQDPIFLELPDI